MKEYLAVLKKYAVFEGRSARREFWMYTLISCIIMAILSVLDKAMGLEIGIKHDSGVLTSLYSLAVLLPAIGVGIRRLHDTSKSGWWLLIGLIPLVGIIVLIVFFATDSFAGANQYGPNPKVATPPPAAPATPAAPVA